MGNDVLEIWRWFIDEGWVAVLAVLNLVLLLVQIFMLRRFRWRIRKVEIQHGALMERLTNTYQEVRRVTGEFNPDDFQGNEDKTKMRRKGDTSGRM